MKNTLSGRWVFDSNILIYGLDKFSLRHQEVFALFTSVRDRKLQAVIAQQNIVETVSTFVRGYQVSIERVRQPIQGLVEELGITIISPLSTTYQRFFSLLDQAKRPVDIFDYYLAATMLDNGLAKIITANDKDFAGIEGVKVYNPWGKS